MICYFLRKPKKYEIEKELDPLYELRIKYHVIRASAETCYECLRGENKQKLEVLSFEKAWDKIEKDTF